MGAAFMLFMTIFLFLWCASSYFDTKGQEKPRGVRKPISFKQMLKNGNDSIKMVLVRKRKGGKRQQQLETMLSVAGVPIKAEEFSVFRWMAVCIGGGVFFLFTREPLLLLAGGIAGYLFPAVWLRRKQKVRVERFNAGLPGMLSSIVGSLRAGFSLLQSLQMVAEESDSPIKEEVELIMKSLQYGTTMENALLEWKKRMPSEDLGLLVEAVLIQRQVGGNLAFLLEQIIETTRERTKLNNQIKTLTAQGRLSGMIISLLPVGLGLVIYIMNPSYIGALFANPLGQGMLAAAGVSQVIGFLFIKKITTIEV